MKKFLIIFTLCLVSIGVNAQSQSNTDMVEIYCEVTCYQYNLFKKDVNALVDFGIADKAKNANGWIYNTETGKKYSFASPMSVFAYMAQRGWKYKDAIIITHSAGLSGGGQSNVWHFILTKEMKSDYSNDDVIGDIDYRTN